MLSKTIDEVISSIADLFPWSQELHLHGNSIGDEGIRALMAGLSSHKGFCFSSFNFQQKFLHMSILRLSYFF